MESALGQGTTFKVYLPIHEESVAPLKSADDVCKGKGERILLVDDEEMLIQLGTRMLRSLGYEVISCLGSEEALKLFGANPNHFDLVLTDQTMPKMKGTQLAQEIKKIRPDIPIILNTGFDERLQEDQLHEAGISEMMMKPYTIHDLSYVISKYCQT
ncbi:MAG: response regulator [bacterium]|nr:response regulator [bacterium]